MFISGALFGLAGMLAISGNWGSYHYYFVDNTGYTSISVGRLAYINPIYCIITGFFFAILRAGSVRLSYVYDIPANLSSILQGVILLFVIMSEFLRWRLRKYD
jgi:simple sugar transport system permease protein